MRIYDGGVDWDGGVGKLRERGEGKSKEMVCKVGVLLGMVEGGVKVRVMNG